MSPAGEEERVFGLLAGFSRLDVLFCLFVWGFGGVVLLFVFCFFLFRAAPAAYGNS